MKTIINISILIISTSLFGCKKEKSGFTADKQEIYIGETIHFIDNDEPRKNCTFTYDFGDGTNSGTQKTNYNAYGVVNGGTGGNNYNAILSDRNPSHIYLSTGTFTVTQTISVSKNVEKGRSRQISSQIKVIVKPIVPEFTCSSESAIVNETIYLKNESKGNTDNYWSIVGTWSFINTSDLSLSSDYSIQYIGQNTFDEAYVQFHSPGIWKISFYIAGKSETKTITIN